MEEKDRHVASAVSACGHNAYRIIESYGVPDGSDLLKAVAMTYLRALAAVIGRPETLQLIQQQYAHIVPQAGKKLELVVSNSAEVSHELR